MKYKESASIIPAIAALIALVYANTMESFIYNIPQMFLVQYRKMWDHIEDLSKL